MPGIQAVAIVIPVFNETGVVEQFHGRLRTVIDNFPANFTIYYINDGSTDGTQKSLIKISGEDPRVIVLELSRNFGHQAALTAGLDHAQGDVVIFMDGDGQHPPELIPEMLRLAEQGYDIVQTQRMDTDQKASFKKWASGVFYSLLNALSGTQVQQGAADFRAMSRQAVDALKAMPEYHRFLRGMVAWIGYPTLILPYQPPERIGGKSKYSIRKMMRLAADAVFSFSLVPLYIGLSMGVMMLCLAGLEMVYVLSFWARGLQANLQPGWSSLMFVLLIVSGFIMILLGFVGMYIGYIFQEVKHRPVYLLREKQGSNQ